MPQLHKPERFHSFISTTVLLSALFCAIGATAQQTTPPPVSSTQAATPAANTPTTTEAAATKSSLREKPAFIIDSLSTPLRTGPGNEYRTIDTVNAGESVTFIGDNPANGFVKIRDNTGTEGWLSGSYVVYTASPKANLEDLKQQLSQQEMIVAQFDQERKSLQQAVKDAESARDKALQETEQAKQTAAQLTARLSEENPELLHNKMVIGGGILAVGLLFGLLLPLITPKRRNRDRWM